LLYFNNVVAVNFRLAMMRIVASLNNKLLLMLDKYDRFMAQ
jgi:hypothetical protein